MNEVTAKAKLIQIVSKYQKCGKISLKTCNELVGFIKNHNVSEITFSFLCDYAVKDRAQIKMLFEILYFLLKNNLYKNEYSEYLYKNIEFVKLSADGWSSKNKSKFFCYERIKNFVFIKNHNHRASLIFFVDSSNPVYFKTIVSFLKSSSNGKARARTIAVEILENIAKKDLITVKSIDDFNDKLFFNVKDKIVNSDFENKDILLLYWIDLFRWLGTLKGYNGLKNSDILPYELIVTKGFLKYISENYKFVVFDQRTVPFGYDKIVFLYYGFDNASSRANSVQWVPVNISLLNSRFYKDILLSFYVHKISIAVALSYGAVQQALRGLKIIESLKSTPGYPDADESHITDIEAFAVRKSIADSDINLRTKNNFIGWVRRLLGWAQEAKYITCDSSVMNNLAQFAEPKKAYGNPVPNDDLKKIVKCLKGHANDSLDNLITYTIFSLCIQTEFRISTICSLKIDSIRPSFKPGRYKVYASTKTTHGEKDNYEITGDVYNLLKNVIEWTHDIRLKAPLSIKKNIFIRPDLQTGRKIVSVYSELFVDRFNSLIQSEGIPHYNAKQLRDTHMSLSMSFIIDDNRSDAELAELTKHRRVDTTIDRYVGEFLEEYLETTYNVLLDGMSDLDTESKIRSEVPENINNVEHSVENGCGFCDSENCIQLEDHYTYSLPCMLCPHFLTTPGHLPYFKEMVKITNDKINNAETRHGIEDYTTMKKVYVAFIKAIYEFLLKKGDVVNATNTKLFLQSNG